MSVVLFYCGWILIRYRKVTAKIWSNQMNLKFVCEELDHVRKYLRKSWSIKACNSHRHLQISQRPPTLLQVRERESRIFLSYFPFFLRNLHSILSDHLSLAQFWFGLDADQLDNYQILRSEKEEKSTFCWWDQIIHHRKDRSGCFIVYATVIWYL